MAISEILWEIPSEKLSENFGAKNPGGQHDAVSEKDSAYGALVSKKGKNYSSTKRNVRVCTHFQIM